MSLCLTAASVYQEKQKQSNSSCVFTCLDNNYLQEQKLHFTHWPFFSVSEAVILSFPEKMWRAEMCSSSDLLVWVGPQPSAGPSSPCCWDDLLPWSLVVWRWTPSVELVVSCLNQASPSRETTARINGETFWPPVWIKPFRLWLVRSHCTRLKSCMTALLLLLSVPNSRPHVILWSVKKRCEHYNKLDYYHDSRIVWRRKSLPEMNSRDKRL